MLDLMIHLTSGIDPLTLIAGVVLVILFGGILSNVRVLS